ncbi:hypothetical protein TSUD_385660 [Trifolium subterraneum]|uniref:Integrase catalytic domain-containing protein n=2 Tax=Trifolium subterraneum TaxID=3900 RepID=A0A2Z6LZ10_TRISU|nr:hypothetical protein TSUD_385660 [Trifolium subterraneum]
MSIESNASVHGGNHGGGHIGTSSQTHNKGYQNDTLNPYFLHPNKNPGLILVTPSLSGTNYHSWSRAMTIALKSKNKLRFVNGTLPRPDDEDHDSLAWDRCNTMIMSWISNAVDADISQSVLWMDTAPEIWQDLKERFYQGDVFRISDIQEEIYTLKQGDNSISAYYTKMKKLWQELDNFRPIPQSNCVHNCAVIAKMKEYKDFNQVIRFLKGLNEQYYAVRSQIMLMDPLPTISKVYSLLVQQERQAIVPIDESKLLAVNGYGASAGRGDSYSSYAGRGQSNRGRGSRGGCRHSTGRGNHGKGNRYCTHCGLTNHIIDDCWKKYGYPPHMQHLQNKHGAVNSCTHANANNGDDEDTQTVTYEEENVDSEAGKMLLTPAQQKALLALLQGSQSLSSHSLNHVTTNSATPQQNGIVERKHQHILGIARALLFQANLPTIFWSYAVSHAVHIINRLPSPFLKQKLPYQMLYNTLPDIDNLKVFGSLVFAATLKEMHDEQWKNAISAELFALMKNNTWSMTTLPSHKKAIGCKWVFKLKLHVDGSIERHKARLVAKGFTQTEVVQQWPLFQLDVNTAFLHGDLHEEVYMKPPPGLVLEHPDLVINNPKLIIPFSPSNQPLVSLQFWCMLMIWFWEDTGLLAAKPCSTPMQPQLQLHKSSSTLLSDPTAYRRLIGRLLYLTHTRPEISYAVSKLSQFLDSPTDAHMLAGLHILRFLKNHPGQGLFFNSSSSLTLKGFSDSDWGACPDTRRSATDLCIPHDSPIILYCDNKSAMHIASNPVFHERTKHIEIDCHVVRDKVQANVLHLLPVSSKEQIADIFTKSLHPGPFQTLQSKLGTIDIHSSLRGDVADTTQMKD